MAPAAMIQPIRPSWLGVFAAPLVAPLVVASLFTIEAHGNSPLFAFLFFLIPGAIVAYAATWFLLLPTLCFASRVVTLRWDWVGLLGLILGIVAFLPVGWICYCSSGPDSGPPVGTFFEYLWRSRADAIVWFFPAAGLVTSLVYWLLGSRTQAICAKS